MDITYQAISKNLLNCLQSEFIIALLRMKLRDIARFR